MTAVQAMYVALNLHLSPVCSNVQVVWFKESSTVEVSLGAFTCSIQLPPQRNAEEVCPHMCHANVQTQGYVAHAYPRLEMFT